MTNTKKRPEVLVPAGTLEKLKVAVNYGADAVFVGGQAYGLRSRAGNFTMDELREGIEYAHARGVDVHVASNMVTHDLCTWTQYSLVYASFCNQRGDLPFLERIWLDPCRLGP